LAARRPPFFGTTAFATVGASAWLNNLFILLLTRIRLLVNLFPKANEINSAIAHFQFLLVCFCAASLRDTF
jgi:hypothetical protein